MKGISLTAVFLLVFFPVFSQSVVVSAYFNATDPRDEWIELLVIADNTDMRSWTIRDNNSSQTSWQTAVTFNNVSFWNNMRAGTIIVLWTRPIKSDGVTAHPLDVNKDDGYLELDATNATYFNGGSFGTAPGYSGNSLNFAGAGDVLQLRDASGTHVHALGHISTPGTDWTALPSPRLNHASSANSGEAIYVCPGNALSDYGTNTPQAGTTWTSKSSATITQGLPNISASSPAANTAFWDTLREPAFSSQTVTPVAVPGSPGSISFSWTGAMDPNSSDGTSGYIILRNTVNSFTAPADGTTYTTGSTIGTATVIAHITSSSTTSYTDSTVMNGNAYFYRVYAYRYGTDNINGNTFHRARGRAYTSAFVDVSLSNPLPVEWTAFSGRVENAEVVLSWSTASEVNNDYFIVERCGGEQSFEAIGTVDGNGTTSQPHSYAFVDAHPNDGMNYYRLRQVDFNGNFRYSNIIAVQLETESSFFTATMTENGIRYSVQSDHAARLVLIDPAGRVTEEIHVEGNSEGTINMPGWSEGMYVICADDGKNFSVKKFMRF